MLIEFTLDNWMSFRNPVSFSMVASRERQHGERVPKLGKYQTRVLPIAAIYGGNASGKTNFFKALSFVKNLVVKGTLPDSLIAVEPFRLDATMANQPTRFSFQLMVEETIYVFSFALTRKAILEERLVQVSSASEKVLYDRRGGEPNFDASLRSDQALQFAFKGTRDNQLFLTNTVSQQVEAFRPVYDWFRDTLDLVAPDSRFEPFEQFLDEGHPLYATMSDALPQLDTGITHLGGEEVPFDNLPMPAALRAKLKDELNEGMTVRLLTEPSTDRYVVTRKSGELIAKKLVTYHPDADGAEVKFNIHQESDGSQRVIDLLPAFLAVSAARSKKVFIIDEVDRSLHTLLIRQLLESYLDCCSPKSRSQLLFTTHDVLLMDQQLFRRDEMWVAERDNSGVSDLISFAEYKDVRYDKDIRKSYLQGRLGGIPRILLSGALSNSCDGQDREATG
ncbi:MAG: ATP-binding protein [Gammaproteobacteria bacterium]|nr:ATP-binding protein [Gammaproteobacteria bacterium]